MWWNRSSVPLLLALLTMPCAASEEGFDWTDVLFLRTHNTWVVVLSTAALGVAAGMVGSFLLLRKRSLMGDALSHATLPGIGIAFAVMSVAGGDAKCLPGLLLGATVSGVLGLLVMLGIGRTTRLRDDVAMGLVLSVFFGLGVAVLGMVQRLPDAAGLESFIYGKPASIVLADFHWIVSLAGIVTVVSVLLFKEFKLLCFDDGFASSQGWPVLVLDVLLLGMVTAVTVIGLQAVGLILIIAFLITPPAAARFWTDHLPTMALLSAVIGGISGWLGASISALTPDLPAGGVIVVVAAAVFLLSMFLAPARGVIGRWLRHARLRQKIGRQHLLRGAYEILEVDQSRSGAPDNHAFPRGELQGKRTWTPRELGRILRREARRGHIEELADGRLRLTEEGFGEAARITRNHRLWEMYLVTHADIAPSHVDRDADMVEHVLEADLVQRLEAALRKQGAWVPQPRSPHRI